MLTMFGWTKNSNITRVEVAFDTILYRYSYFLNMMIQTEYDTQSNTKGSIEWSNSLK